MENSDSKLSMTHNAYVLLGTNLGDKLAYLKRATELIEQRCGSIERYSSIYETSAWGIETQPSFLNQAVLVRTELSPIQLLQALLGIETDMGRHRTTKWAPRTIDLDIAFYDALVLDSKSLVVPHPRIHERNFALAPLCEIAPDLLHPVLKRTISELLEDSSDAGEVTILAER